MGCVTFQNKISTTRYVDVGKPTQQVKKSKKKMVHLAGLRAGPVENYGRK